MASLTKHIVAILVLVVTLFSCDQQPTLQTYFVDNQEQPNFMSLDVPLSMLKIDENTLSLQQKEAYHSVQKLNMIAYKKDSLDTTNFDAELAKVKTILKDKKYKELMRGGNSTDGKFVINYLGEDDDIDEFILFGSANNMGFAVVRILGDDMDPAKMMQLSSVLNASNVDNAQIEQVMNFFK